MPMLIDAPILSATPAFSRRVRFQSQHVTDLDVQNSSSPSECFVCRMLREQCGFTFVWNGPPLFASRVPIQNGKAWDDYLYIEGWKEDLPYFARVPKELGIVDQAVFDGNPFKTLTVELCFYPLQ